MGACILVAFIAAAIASLGLKALATPADFDERQALLEQRVRQIERLAALPGDSGAYPKGAVCGGFEGEALAKMRRVLEDGSVAENLQNVRISWGVPTNTGGKLVPLPLRIEADGPYDRVLSLLDRVGRDTPKIFVDTVDLTKSAAGAHLALSGKVFCWTRD
jgi:hypothetical protein